ncbi:unnamed protein product [Ranitomeya imitator]|uniref:Cytokine-like nuclear factor N-PAC n=1 Tax=Ranitomeya imitator TaxID=111125 RepID=A0ABN9M066_9NEOB|nr:unnamed protein product [Ranitomeya imitator]
MAATVSLRQGDLVWGKLGRYPPWPRKDRQSTKRFKKPRGKKCLFVKFFGTEDHAWIKVEQLKPYNPHKEEMIKANKGKRFQQAVDAVEEFIKKVKARQEQNASDDKGKQSGGKKAEGKGKKPAGEKKKKKSSDSGSSKPSKRSHEQSPRKRGRPPKEDKDSRSPQPSSLKKLAMKTVSRFSWPPPTSERTSDDPHFSHYLLSRTEKEDTAGDSWLLHRHRTLGTEMVLKKPSVTYQAISKRLKVSEEDTGSTSIQAADSTALNGNITPTDKKIGFSRVGLNGQRHSIQPAEDGAHGHRMEPDRREGIHSEVWDQDEDTKCDLFIQEGAHLGRTPAEVVSTCDITFACVADPTAAKDLVLGPQRGAAGDPSREVLCGHVYGGPRDGGRVIVSRGGRFLEAPVAGNQQLSNDGMLMILAAGDHSVFEDCTSCFQAMGRTSFFLGEVGNAARMMLIINMVQGSFMATIAEGMTLAQVTGQSQQTLLDILIQSQLSSIFLDQKCQNILQGNFKPDFYLKYIQKDLRLAIAMGDSVNHPTPMAAAANEVYKRAKALDQSDNDMSAVYRAYIH